MQDSAFAHLPRTWQQCIRAYLQADPFAASRHTRRAMLACFLRDFCISPAKATDDAITAFLVSPSHAPQSPGKPIAHSTQLRRRGVLESFYVFASSYQVNGRPLYRKPLPPTLLDTKRSDDPFAHLPEAWRSATEVYLQSVLDHSGSEASLKDYRSTLARFFAFVGGKSPELVTNADVRAFINLPSQGRRSRGKPVAAATKNHRIMTISSYYSFMSTYTVDGGEPLYQKASPTNGVRYLKPSRPYRSMSTEELAALFNAIDRSTIKGKRDFAILSLAFWTCRRRSELARIRFGDIQPAVFTENGSQRTGWTYRYSEKGRSRESRIKELPGPAYQALHAYLESSGRLATIKPDDPLFVAMRRRKLRPLDSQQLNAIFKQYATKAGLPVERLSIHSMRSVGAVERLNSGATVPEIQQTLGHQSPSTTWLYLQFVAAAADNAVAKLEARLPFLSQSATRNEVQHV